MAEQRPSIPAERKILSDTSQLVITTDPLRCRTYVVQIDWSADGSEFELPVSVSELSDEQTRTIEISEILTGIEVLLGS